MGVLVCPPGAARRWPDSGGEAGPIVVGLVNNMPDAALHATERQFLDLLSAASGVRTVRLRLLHVPEVPRGDAGRAHVGQHYETVAQLGDGDQLDGLIVTGTEPRARRLEDEPYWPALARLADRVEDRAVPTVWSCLAAQVAVLRADGIVRRPFDRKLSGVFDCVRAAEHPITAGFPPRWRVPQTRRNDLPEAELAASGYQVLSRLPDAGADVFAREGRSLQLFVQGHPEYDPRALCREYKRDIERYLTGAQDAYPDPMRGYFEAPVASALEAFRARALRTRAPALMLELPAALAGWEPAHDWREPAVRLYANWLTHVSARKDRGDALARRRPAAGRPHALGATPLREPA
jgi:homoserine O-succinyltransferase